jgi:8-oxo-dGTP diphosphatase
LNRTGDKRENQLINHHVSVDCVVFGFDENQLKVLLIKQKKIANKPNELQEERLALPGNLVFENESLDAAAERVLKELTKLKGIQLKQCYAFGNPSRVKDEKDAHWLKTYRTEPDARVITIAYYAVVRMEHYQPKAGSFAESSGWYDINNIPNLAFDHNLIVEKALEALRDELMHHSVGFDLLPEKFTLSQLQTIYEIILDKEIDKRNFRKLVKSFENLIALEERQTGVNHKPAQLYTLKRG